MKAKKLLALVLCAVMLLSLAACNEGSSDGTTTAPTTSTPPATNPTDPPAPKGPASVDFEDGSMSFAAVYTDKVYCDNSTIEVVDYKGSKALKVTNGSGQQPHVAFDVTSLLGENASKVASIEVSIGLEHSDGEFYAASGTIITWTGENAAERTHAWSVYLKNKNPKVCAVTLDTAGGEVFSAETPNIFMVRLIDDNFSEATEGAQHAVFYIDDIRFLDADGNLLEADSSVTFVAPKNFSSVRDMSNLKYLGGKVLLENSACSMEGWKQAPSIENGYTIDGITGWKDLMVPGAIIEIEYTSDDGSIWLVFPDAAIGWTRVGLDNIPVAKNDSMNIAQITYEDIASLLGEDVSAWGDRIQCEAMSKWEVYAVSVGTDSGLVTTTNKTLLDGSSISGGAWGQTDVGSSVDQWLPLMVPGAVIEIQYKSDNGDMWIVLPDATKDGQGFWARMDTVSNFDGTTAQITYEDIVSILGEDTSLWGGRIQCEASGNWEVYSVTIGTAE